MVQDDTAAILIDFFLKLNIVLDLDRSYSCLFCFDATNTHRIGNFMLWPVQIFANYFVEANFYGWRLCPKILVCSLINIILASATRGLLTMLVKKGGSRLTPTMLYQSYENMMFIYIN